MARSADYKLRTNSIGLIVQCHAESGIEIDGKPGVHPVLQAGTYYALLVKNRTWRLDPAACNFNGWDKHNISVTEASKFVTI